MSYDLYLSFSGWSTYKVCPLKYRLKYVDKVEVARDPRSAMLGLCAGKVFEWFYERELWALPDPVQACLARIDEAVEYNFAQERWDPQQDPGFRPKLTDELRKVVRDGVVIIKDNKFLTPYSRAEVDLTVTYEHSEDGLALRMGGRCDFSHGEDRLDVTLLDGKSSRWREKYADPDQLIWYAVQHCVKYHVAPKRLGFVFWAFPEDPVMWIEFDAAALRRVINEAFVAARQILAKEFGATPSDECRLCDYRAQCEAGTDYVDRRALETRGRISDSVFFLEDASGGDND